MKLFTLESDRLDPVEPTTLGAEWQRQDLLRVLSRNIDVVESDLLVIAEDYGDQDDGRPRIDLLAIDRRANLAVIAVEPAGDGAQAELCALGAAAMVSSLTAQQAVAAYRQHLAEQVGEVDAEKALLDFLGWEQLDDERFGNDVRVLLVAQEFSRTLTTTVLWLVGKGLDIRCVRLCPYRLGDRVLLDVHQIIPLPEASGSAHPPGASAGAGAGAGASAKAKAPRREKQRDRKDSRPAAAGGSQGPYYYVHVDDGNGRRWEDCQRYHFVAAGGGRRQIEALRKLEPGDFFYAYQKGNGYVGLGKVVEAAVPVTEFEADSKPLLECELKDPSIGMDATDPDLCDWAARVEWIAAVPSSEAFWQEDMFANQNVVCRLRHEMTLRLLGEQFGEQPADESADPSGDQSPEQPASPPPARRPAII